MDTRINLASSSARCELTSNTNASWMDYPGWANDATWQPVAESMGQPLSYNPANYQAATTNPNHNLMEPYSSSSPFDCYQVFNDNDQSTLSTVQQQTNNQKTRSSQPTIPGCEIRCYEHDCTGRRFSSLGNYWRHLREKNQLARKFPCRIYGKAFTRLTVRNLYHKIGVYKRRLSVPFSSSLYESDLFSLR